MWYVCTVKQISSKALMLRLSITTDVDHGTLCNSNIKEWISPSKCDSNINCANKSMNNVLLNDTLTVKKH